MSLHSELLILLIVANGAPILLDNLLGPRRRWPIDGGRVRRDGRRLLGDSLTMRGAVGAVAGGQLKRTAITQDPAPRELEPCIRPQRQGPRPSARGHWVL